MASICANDTDIIWTNGTVHRFKVNYYKIRDMSIGQYITSPRFNSGVHEWTIDFYPKGNKKDDNEDDYASIFLKHVGDLEAPNVSFCLGISNFRNGKLWREDSCHTFNKFEVDWGYPTFIQRTYLEKQYVTNGFFDVLCTINFEEVTTELSQECCCGAFEDISKLIETGEMMDVKFEVEGDVFRAHKVILGARSPVFKAELFGSMSETRMECIKIEDMKSEVFKALLHFVYTYSLPIDADTHMIQHLLVAADRYDIKGLIMKCEKRLIENISLGTVLGFLICAEQHNFSTLKNACVEFATQKDNFIKLALTKEYGNMMNDFPSLLVALREIFSRTLDL